MSGTRVSIDFCALPSTTRAFPLLSALSDRNDRRKHDNILDFNFLKSPKSATNCGVFFFITVGNIYRKFFVIVQENQCSNVSHFCRRIKRLYRLCCGCAEKTKELWPPAERRDAKEMNEWDVPVNQNKLEIKNHLKEKKQQKYKEHRNMHEQCHPVDSCRIQWKFISLSSKVSMLNF